MFTLLAFPINILLNPLICKIKRFFVKKATSTDKIYTTGSVLLEVKSGSLICEESFFCTNQFQSM